jgi:hypothetical protein
MSFNNTELPLKGYGRTVVTLKCSAFNSKLWIISKLPQVLVAWDNMLLHMIQKLTSAKCVKKKSSTIKCYFSATTIPQPPIGQEHIYICIMHKLDGSLFPLHADSFPSELNVCAVPGTLKLCRVATTKSEMSEAY